MSKPVWEYENAKEYAGNYADSLTVKLNPHGLQVAIGVSLTGEAITLPLDQAKSLRDWLIEALAPS